MLKELVKRSMPHFLISWYHYGVAFFGALLNDFPGRKIKVIGITGTNGKTTTANLTAAILEKAGYKVAVASSIKFKIDKEEKENKLKMTMPGRAVLQKFLADAVKAKCDYAIIEATSEGVLQHRHRFIKWQTMVFTNLSPEHIERHRGFENYKKAKGEYFKACKNVHIINIDDENAEYFSQFFSQKKYFFSLNKDKLNKDKLNNDKLLDENKKISNVHISSLLHSSELITPRVVFGENVKEEKDGYCFSVRNVNFYLPLLGKFNVYNALAAIGVGLSQGVSLEVCQKALTNVGGVPGRMEEVIKKPFRVVVDYAFTPNALEQVYRCLQPEFKQGCLNSGCKQRTICVLGACGGGRDKWKRPVLGQIAAKYCDEIIITNEDPYDEDPMDIINQVAEGAKEVARQLPYYRKLPSNFLILDRREAIRKAIELARPGDTVVITGKGCEPWICVENGRKIPWDDRQVVREEFQI
ncbi:hypothetical protein COT20_02540 [bacterium (Candidatus Gribaldobacteria) CG08_land_8_20_14_0_20_39_15]|uniref:UDP-N-acetylmuramoyl-L-alanyl-D-glutamate--2, 6-diaminopimelate ligase n=1 Tax=bacterium (Candidatus Gribaldobacteria) CG08_land_8_20_14_0_20_39_15 TaxID=2014273 RepID=A0A2M6XU09_9BACT|nr:MAG: hypothetical protein COT20_02540 [bacterium (Candidatus Gribaldobacteria) CG08_land_8_20_14_0_20_39_15]